MNKALRAFLALLLALLCGSAAAGGIRPYNAQEFNSLTHQGKPVLLVFEAGWCQTCQVQLANIAGLLEGPDYNGLEVLTVDYSTEKHIAQQFQVGREATLVLFKGPQEVARKWLAVTTRSIQSLLHKVF